MGAAVKTGSVQTFFPFPLPFEMSGTRLEEILVEGVKEVRVNVPGWSWPPWEQRGAQDVCPPAAFPSP